MENDILDSLNDLGYQGPLNDEVAFAKALDGGPKSLEFTKLVHILAEELKQLCRLEETVSVMNDPDESSSFLLELSSFLKELGCPYKCLVTGHMSSRLQSKEDRLLLLDYMISELMAARMVQVDGPKEKTQSNMEIVMQESPTAKDLKEILISLKFNKPPPNITPEMLFTKLEAKLKETVQKEGEKLVGKPLYNKALSEKDWKNLETSFIEMFEEYRLRRETLITRLECTIQSFEWSDRLKTKKDTIQSVYRPKREALKVKPNVKLSDFLAARTSLLQVEKTSSASVRKNTQSEVNKVIIGQVPDRGGRPNEQQPPPPEMPSWQQRSAPQGGGRGGGRGGGARGGGDSGRGARGGGRGGRVQGGYSQATGQEQASETTSNLRQEDLAQEISAQLKDLQKSINQNTDLIDPKLMSESAENMNTKDIVKPEESKSTKQSTTNLVSESDWPAQKDMTEWFDKISDEDCWNIFSDALGDYNFDESSDENVEELPSETQKEMPKDQRLQKQPKNRMNDMHANVNFSDDAKTKTNLEKPVVSKVVEPNKLDKNRANIETNTNVRKSGVTNPNPANQSNKKKSKNKNKKKKNNHALIMNYYLEIATKNLTQTQGVKRTQSFDTNIDTKKMRPDNKSKAGKGNINVTPIHNKTDSNENDSKNDNEFKLYTSDKFLQKDVWVVISDKNGVPFDQNKAKILLQEIEKVQYELVSRYENAHKKMHKIPIPLPKYQPELKNGSLCIAPRNGFTVNWLKITVQNLPGFWEGCEGYITTTMPFYHLGVLGLPEFFSPCLEKLIYFLKAMNTNNFTRLNIENWKIFVHRVKKCSESPQSYNHIVAMGIPSEDHAALERNLFRVNYKLTQVTVMSFEYKAFTEHDVEKFLDDCEALLDVTVKKSPAICEQEVSYKEIDGKPNANVEKTTNVREEKTQKVFQFHKPLVDQSVNITRASNDQQSLIKSHNESQSSNLKGHSQTEHSIESYGNDFWVIISDKKGEEIDEKRANLLRKAIEKAQFEYVLEATKSERKQLAPVFRFEPVNMYGSLCFVPQDNFTKNWLEKTVECLPSLWEKCNGFITEQKPYYYLGIVGLPNFFTSDKETLRKFFTAINLKTESRRSNLLSTNNWVVYNHRVKPSNDGFDHIIAVGVPIKDYNTLSAVQFRLNYRLSQVRLAIIDSKHYTDEDIENAMDECEKSLDKTCIKESFGIQKTNDKVESGMEKYDERSDDSKTNDDEHIGQASVESYDQISNEPKTKDTEQTAEASVSQKTSDNLDISLNDQTSTNKVQEGSKQPKNLPSLIKDDRNVIITGRKRHADQVGLIEESAEELKKICDKLLNEFSP